MRARSLLALAASPPSRRRSPGRYRRHWKPRLEHLEARLVLSAAPIVDGPLYFEPAEGESSAAETTEVTLEATDVYYGPMPGQMGPVPFADVPPPAESPQLDSSAVDAAVQELAQPLSLSSAANLSSQAEAEGEGDPEEDPAEAPTLEILVFYGITESGGIWSFEGDVEYSGDYEDVIIQFGGLFTDTTTLNSSGSFMFLIDLGVGATGDVSAIATDGVLESPLVWESLV